MTEGPCRRANFGCYGVTYRPSRWPIRIDRVVSCSHYCFARARRCFSHRARASAFGGYARLVDVKEGCPGQVHHEDVSATTAKANKRR